MSKIIDIHCHYIGFNPKFLTKEEGNGRLRRFILTGITLRAYCRILGIKYSRDFEFIREKFEDALLETINNSQVDNFVVLALDGVYDKQGELIRSESAFYASNETVYNFKKKSKKVLIGASINPDRKDALGELRKVKKNGAVLVKLHPVFMRFDPSNKKYSEFYKLAARLKLPLLFHVGFESSIPGAKMDERYNKPELIIPALKCGATVILAHAGGNGFLEIREKKRMKIVTEMLEKYPNLYLDDAGIFGPHSKQKVKSLLNNKLALERTIHGSDFPVFPYESIFIPEIGIKKAMELKKIRNIVEREIELKKALGFPDEIFERGYSVLGLKQEI